MGCGCNKKIKTSSISKNKTTNAGKNENNNKVLLNKLSKFARKSGKKRIYVKKKT
tara:strand:- start:491 stop:655 length:165 start_codon:yes stop_codon:yes gene_type:complete